MQTLQGAESATPQDSGNEHSADVAQNVVPTRGVKARTTSPVWYIEVASPIGALVVTSDGAAVTGVYMESQRHAPVERGHWIRDDAGEIGVLNLAREQLRDYFDGLRLTFDLPLQAAGTGVQQEVWRELSAIPFGETRSYGEIARSVGKPKASRAVGAANGRNPIPIIVPCHRVIGSNGALTGFGGGVERKEWLLAHEARVSGRPTRFGRAGLFDKPGAESGE